LSAIAWDLRRPLIRLLDLGTTGYGRIERRQLRVMNAMAALIAVSSTFYAVSYALADSRLYYWIIVINLGLAAVACLAPVLHRIHPAASGLFILGAQCPGLIALVALLGRDSGIQLNLIVGAAAAFVVFGGSRPRLGVFVVVALFASHLTAWFLFPAGALAVESKHVVQL